MDVIYCLHYSSRQNPYLSFSLPIFQLRLSTVTHPGKHYEAMYEDSISERSRETWREQRGQGQEKKDGQNFNQNEGRREHKMCDRIRKMVKTCKMELKVLFIMLPRTQCARSMRVRKSRPVSQFCHTLFTTDIISYIQVTHKENKHPFEIWPCFPPCFNLLAALCCSTLHGKLFKKASH